MAKPTVRVRIGFTDGPYETAPTWTDVTSYVRNIQTSRGRTDDWQNFGTGNATVVLDNRDRRYDPTYSAGPYYGNLLPRRQIRIDATTDSVTYYNIFRGFIDGWPVNLTNAGFDSTVTVTCYDALGLLAQEQCPTDWADAYIQTLAPTHYWRLAETIDPSGLPTTAAACLTYLFADAGTGNAPMVPSQENRPIANIEPLGRNITSKAISFANGAAPYANGSIYPGLTGNATFTLCAWHRFQDSTGLNLPAFAANTVLISSQYTTIEINYDITNQRFIVTLFPYAASSTTRTYYYNTGLDLSAPHHVAVAMTVTGTNTATISVFMVDGVQLTQTSSATATKLPITGLTYSVLSVGEGSSQQVVLNEGSTWTSTQLRTIYQLGNNVLTESTSARFDRIRAQTLFSAALCNTPVYPAGTVADLTPGGAYITNELQLTSDSEGGELYVDKSGNVTMTSRTYFETGYSLTNQATFGVGGIPIGTEMSYYWSAEGIRNSLEIGWAGDANYTASDADSITAYGVCQDSYDTTLSTLADVQNLASYLVGFGRLPRLIMSAVEVGQALSAAQWDTVLALELLERITVVVDEPVGSDLSQVQLVQQIEHDITPGDWRTRILGSSRWSSYFILDTSTLDSTDLLG